MVLKKEIYKEFEKVVGSENINDGEVITNVYAYNWCMEIFNYMDGKEPIPFSPVPKGPNHRPSNRDQSENLA